MSSVPTFLTQTIMCMPWIGCTEFGRIGVFDCMENNKAPAVSLEDGSDVLRIVEAARESSAKGKTVALA